MRRWAVPGLSIAILSILLLGASHLYFPASLQSDAKTIAAGAINFDELSERFTELAKKRGAVYAYDVLREAELPPNTDLHLLGHVVGEELYNQQGVDGMASCTHDFRNACSHSVVIGALGEFGTGAHTQEILRSACEQAPGGPGAYTMCYHGLGHGVFAHFGYNLDPTIAFCRETGSDAYHREEYGQCMSGAVMELLSGGGHDRDLWLASREKYLSPDRPLDVCLSLDEEVQQLCLVYLTPQLFVLAGADIGRPDPETFPRAFSYCNALEEQHLRDSCYGGFGKEFIPLVASRDIRGVDVLDDEAYEVALAWCESSEAEDGRSACIRNALQSVFWGGENDSEASFRLCSLVENEQGQRACYDELASVIYQYTHGSRQEELCSALPSEFQTACSDGNDIL